MKKLIPLLIVGMFILIGFGAGATPSKQITYSQSGLVLDFYGGLGVHVVFRNIGNVSINTSWYVIVDTNFYHKVIHPYNGSLEPGARSELKCVSFGFGNFDITVNYDNMTEMRQGFIFGPFAFLKK